MENNSIFAMITAGGRRTAPGLDHAVERVALTLKPGRIADMIEAAHRATCHGLQYAPLSHCQAAIDAQREICNAISDLLQDAGVDWYGFGLVSSVVAYPDQWEHHFTVSVTVDVDVPKLGTSGLADLARAKSQ